MFIIKLFRGGTRNPEQVEFYTTDAPVVVESQELDKSHEIEISVGNRSEFIDVMVGDQVYIENADGVTIHSIR